jgi:NADPH2:quinone reductase
MEEFGAPEVLKLQEDTRELTVGRGEVLLSVHSAGVNPADTYIRSGVYAHLPSLPWTPGLEAAGLIAEIGEGVTDFQVGQPVCMCCVSQHGGLKSHTGAYASRLVANSDTLMPLPPNVDLSTAGGIPVAYETAYRALKHATNASTTDTVLIHGASGAVGLAAIQTARALGVGTIIGTAATPAGREAILAQGADFAFNHKEDGYQEEMMRASSGGFSVILEMLANVNLGQDLKMLRSNGRVAVIGNRGLTEIDAREAMLREASIHGVFLWAQSWSERQEANGFILDGLAKGALAPVVTEAGIFLLAAAAQAHHEVIARTTVTHGKVLLRGHQ